MDGKAKTKLSALEIQRTQEVVEGVVKKYLAEFVKYFASKSINEMFGKGEFEFRDLLLNLGRDLQEAVIEDRKKGGT